MRELLDELGLSPETFVWQDLALCYGIVPDSSETDIFFDRYKKDPSIRPGVDKMCSLCPVRQFCYEAHESDGQWGGVFFEKGEPIDA